MTKVESLLSIIDGLQPNMSEMFDNSQYFYWTEYAIELDELAYLVYSRDDLVHRLNKTMKDKFSLDPEHHAAVDVATTLEEVYPEQFKGVFVYE